MALYRSQSAVTLIELMISLAIFAVVMVIALDAFSRTIKYTRESVQRQNLQDHAQFLFETMDKEIRFAKIKTDDLCDDYYRKLVNEPKNLTDDPSTIENNQLYYITAGGKELRFIDYKGYCVRYFLSPDPTSPDSVQRLTIERYDPTAAPGMEVKTAFVTPGTINVQSLYFKKTDLVTQSGPALRKPATVAYYLKLSSILWNPPSIDYFNFVTARNFEQF